MTRLAYHILLDLDGEKWTHSTSTTTILPIRNRLTVIR